LGARPKFDYVRSEPYRRFVASFPCLSCGIEGFSQAAHPNQAKYGKGKGIKASDRFVFALCGPHHGLIGCHAQLDLSVGITRADRNMAEDRYVERMMMFASRDGWNL
jgi:hypothetical protein